MENSMEPMPLNRKLNIYKRISLFYAQTRRIRERAIIVEISDTLN